MVNVRYMVEMTSQARKMVTRDRHRGSFILERMTWMRDIDQDAPMRMSSINEYQGSCGSRRYNRESGTLIGAREYGISQFGPDAR